MAPFSVATVLLALPLWRVTTLPVTPAGVELVTV
jgi:hypothetical protein